MRRSLPLGFATLLPVAAALLPFSALAAQQQRAQPVPETFAERRGWEALTPHVEVVSFYEELTAASPYVRMREIGRSREGRSMYLVALSRPAVSEPWQAHASGKPIVLIGAQVHGDEPAGKEGLMLFARDLATGPLNGLLDDVVFLFVPQLNPDGAEAGTWGSRSNRAGYNLNRDYLRLDNPETRAFVQNAIVAWRPHVIVDAHELPGPPRIYDFYTLHPANLNGPHVTSRYTADRVIPAIVAAVEDAGFSHFVYHRVPGGLAGDSELGLSAGSYGARALTSYGGAQGAISILYESLRQRDARIGIERRARMHGVAMEGLARFVAANAGEVVATVEEGRAEMRRLGARWDPADSIAVRVEEVPRRRADYRFLADDEIVEMNVPILDSAVVTLGRIRPVGYAIEPHRSDVAEHLRRHGLEVERLLAPVRARAESFLVDSVRISASPYEGHTPRTFWTANLPADLDLPAGSFIVRADQPNAALAFHLLEPDDDNSLASVGWFAAEERPGGRLSVHRLVELPRVPRETVWP